MIDRYKNHDMPLGWLLPNDGYGAGYGQTETLDGNIQNLKSLTDYAHKNGVEIGLWTQSDLHPKDSISALLQRDIVKEVRDAGVRVLKTDVAWVGWGYSFGLNGVADVGHIMPYYGNDARPFIISLDGWAGTQRYAGVWSGDQTGGQWEYIRFHIPTYIGSGLSGQPNITSDMDGIFGGKNLVMNTRDFQWKTWTPMELNMDGWGSNEKYPHALGEPATSINRWYLKMKSCLMPYAYSIAREAVDQTSLLFKAIKPKGGEMPVVMGAGGSGILLHEAIGHTFEADFNRKNVSIFADQLNKKVCNEHINVVDDGTIPFNRGSVNFDDEGAEGQKTYLIKDGVLTSYLHDRISAKHYGVEPTGNGRRESFRNMPIPRMRATYMEAGNVNESDIISSVKKGIFVDNFTNGQVQIGAGDFTFFVKSGYMIEDGKLTQPIKDINIIGNGPKALADITMVADNDKIDNGTWTCGKDGQSCPVTCGMPSALVSKLTVGGEN